MPTNEARGSLKKRCHNCGLPCNGIFCCDWCLNTYIARRDAHRVDRRRRARSRPDKGLASGAD